MKKLLLILSIVIFNLVSLWSLQATTQAAPPADFEKTEIISDLNQPTAFRFLPDGRLLIAEKAGAIKVYANGQLQSNPLITLVVLQSDNADERGLLGIEPDPDFATNGYLYVAYTNAENHDQLSRITITGETADPSSEVVFLESDQAGGVFHHGGEVRFGPDGKLYWAMGDNTYNPNSQALGNIHGKIHRLNKDGTIPTDNPFYNTPNTSKSIWSYGLRNPFRFDFLPDGRPIVGDVGGAAWEEVNIIEKGVNYGWPNAEGVCTNCPYTNPIFVYAHTAPPQSAGSITATALYRGNTFPSEYTNAFFYGDYTLSFIRYLKFDSSFSSVISDNPFDNEAGTVVQLSQGPDGNLYQMNIYPGAIYKIAPSGGNRAPVVKIQADKTADLAPLTVAFTTTGTNDPENDSLTYAWDFGDGSSSAEINPTHTYTQNGAYTASLTVSDGQKSTSASISITVGNRIPAGVITSPIANAKYNAGDTITFSGTGTDPEDGELPDSAFEWNFTFHHADHIHPFFQTVTGTKTGTFAIPQVSDNVSTTWYEIKLTVTDAGGLKHTSSAGIYPNLVTLTFTPSVSGGTYTIDGVPVTGTFSEQAVVGVQRVLGVPSPQYIGTTAYEFSSWSDGGAQTHTITTPTTDAAYNVTLTPAALPPDPWVSSDIGSRTLPGNSRYVDGKFTIIGGGNDIWGENDEMRLVHQPFSGDGEIIAKVTSQSPTDPWTKSGIMIKESATAGSPYVMIAVTPGNGLIMQQNFTGTAGTVPTYSLPLWLKLKRVGNTFTGSYSSNGTNWTQIGTATVLMNTTAQYGLFVSAHNTPNMNTTEFDSVSVRSAVTNEIPSSWSQTDVGSPTLAGSASYANNTFTIKGAGIDIWDTNDQFHYVYKQLTGDGEIVARVTSQSRTHASAKAGVMIKESATALAPYAMVGITPDNGYKFQWTFLKQSASGGSYTLPNAWVKLKRSGNVITAYKSTDGITWSQFGGNKTVAMSETVTVGLFVTSHDAGALSTTTFDNVSVKNTLPSPWNNTDIGTPLLTGSSVYTNASFSVTGAGRDIWSPVDEAQYAYQTLNGDGEIIARIQSQTNTDAWAKAGVMIKESTTTFANYVNLLVTPGNGVHMQNSGMGDIAGNPTPSLPLWMKLAREGNVFTSYTSPDSVTWTKVGSMTVVMNASVKVGMVVTSHNENQLSTVVFDNVLVRSLEATGTLPAPWSNMDVGSPAIVGASGYSNNTFTLKGAGNDIWGTDDQFQFAHQSLSGDGEIVARVTYQSNTAEYAKAGIMIKQSTTAFSPYAMVGITPENGVLMQYNFNGSQAGGSYTLPNAWLKLKRAGNTFTAYTSTNGTDWTQVGTTSISMSTNARIGLFVTSHNGQTRGTAMFDNVTVTNTPPSPVPAPWQNKDVGNPTLVGSAAYANGEFSVTGAGIDIWDTNDQFQFVYQPLLGNGQIIARITSQSRTHASAKAGVMIKESATAFAPYTMIGITPDNGYKFQWTFLKQSDSGGAYTLPNAWVKLTRVGNTFTSYKSFDRVTWTQVGSPRTIAMNSSAVVGLFVTSHNGSSLSTATFDNVLITQN